MKSSALSRLQHLLEMASAAEASRLAGVLAEIAACRDRAARLRGKIDGSEGSEAPGGASLAVAEMAAASRWGLRLAERACAEELHAIALEAEAKAIRPRLSRAFGREVAATVMAEKARFQERQLAARRAEAAVIAPRPRPDQPVSSTSDSATTSAGSPGIA
jgi:hypothetical protein